MSHPKNCFSVLWHLHRHTHLINEIELAKQVTVHSSWTYESVLMTDNHHTSTSLLMLQNNKPAASWCCEGCAGAYLCLGWTWIIFCIKWNLQLFFSMILHSIIIIYAQSTESRPLIFWGEGGWIDPPPLKKQAKPKWFSSENKIPAKKLTV